MRAAPPRSATMACFTKQAARFLRVGGRYPRAGLSFLLRALDLLPGFRRSVQYRTDRYQEKLRLKARKEPIGHALGDRTVVCTLLGRELYAIALAEGAEATADQFYLNRPLDDARHLIKLAEPFVCLGTGDLVFDPGCGAGRHLLYLVDRFACRGVGVDVHAPAIEVAKVADPRGLVRFLAESSIAPGFLDRELPGGCDVVFINSWLNHVKDYQGYQEFAAEVLDKSRFLLVITSAKDDLQALFVESEILVHEERDGTRFAVIRGRRS